MACRETDVLPETCVRDEARRHLLAQPTLGNAQEPRRLDDGEDFWRRVHGSTRGSQVVATAGVRELRERDVAAVLPCGVPATRVTEVSEGRRVPPALCSPVASVAECVRPGTDMKAAVLRH